MTVTDDPHLDAILEGLKDSSPAVVNAARSRIGQYGQRVGRANLLRQVLGFDDVEVEAVFKALGTLDGEDVAYVGAAVTVANDPARSRASRVAAMQSVRGFVKLPEVRSALLDLIEHETDTDIALTAVGFFPDPDDDVVERLRGWRGHEDDRRRAMYFDRAPLTSSVASIPSSENVPTTASVVTGASQSLAYVYEDVTERQRILSEINDLREHVEALREFCSASEEQLERFDRLAEETIYPALEELRRIIAGGHEATVIEVERANTRSLFRRAGDSVRGVTAGIANNAPKVWAAYQLAEKALEHANDLLRAVN